MSNPGQTQVEPKSNPGQTEVVASAWEEVSPSVSWQNYMLMHEEEERESELVLYEYIIWEHWAL